MTCQTLLAALFLILVTLVMLISSSQDKMEICMVDQFHGKCTNSLIYATYARYGRMKTGKCITSNKEINCYKDVLPEIDNLCSGRPECQFTVGSYLKPVNPCKIEDMTKYLEISYKCVNVYMAEDVECTPGRIIPINISHQKLTLPNIISVKSNKGTKTCPWTIQALPGQQIKVTLVNFNRVYNSMGTKSYPCLQYATVKEGKRSKLVTGCESENRIHDIYQSNTNEITIEIYQMKTARNVSFFLEFQAVGCGNKPGWPHDKGLWVQRLGTNTARGTCNSTKQVWDITCVNGKWVGSFGQCTASKGSIESRSPNPKAPSGHEQFPYGILIVVAIGVALGVFLGGLLLICAARFIRKRSMPNAPPDLQQQYTPASDYIPREDLQQYTTGDPKCTITSTTAHGYKTCQVRGHTCNADKDKIQQHQCYGTLPPGYHCSPTVLKTYGQYYDTDTTGIESRDPV